MPAVLAPLIRRTRRFFPSGGRDYRIVPTHGGMARRSGPKKYRDCGPAEGGHRVEQILLNFATTATCRKINNILLIFAVLSV